MKFQVPNIEIDIAADQLGAVVEELDLLASTRFGESARDLAATLHDERDALDIGQLPVAQFWPLLRALDHVRNADQAGGDVLRLRDALVAGGITYTVQEPNGHEGTFFSYAGTYVEGDRLVGGPAGAVRVERVVERENNPTLLICRDW